MSPYQDQAIKDVADAFKFSEESLRESIASADKMWHGSTSWNLCYAVEQRARVLELEAATKDLLAAFAHASGGTYGIAARERAIALIEKGAA